jgi:hypothetical protein
MRERPKTTKKLNSRRRCAAERRVRAAAEEK